MKAAASAPITATPANIRNTVSTPPLASINPISVGPIAEAIRKQGTDDFCTHLGLISQGLGPYALGAEYSIIDPYLYMLASWYPGEKSELYSRAPKLEAHAKLMAARPAVAKVEADHAQ